MFWIKYIQAQFHAGFQNWFIILQMKINIDFNPNFYIISAEIGIFFHIWSQFSTYFLIDFIILYRKKIVLIKFFSLLVQTFISKRLINFRANAKSNESQNCNQAIPSIIKEIWDTDSNKESNPSTKFSY